MPFRLNQSLSDLGGYDPAIHAGTVAGTMEVLLDIFGNATGRPLNDVRDLMWVYRHVRRYRATLTNVYRPNAFRTLVVAARAFVEEHRRGRQDRKGG